MEKRSIPRSSQAIAALRICLKRSTQIAHLWMFVDPIHEGVPSVCTGVVR